MRVLMAKLGGRRGLWVSVLSWEGNMKVSLTKLGWVVVDWIYLHDDKDRGRAVLNKVMNLQVLWNAGYLVTGWELFKVLISILFLANLYLVYEGVENLSSGCYCKYKVVQIWPGLICTNVHTNQSRSYLNHLVQSFSSSKFSNAFIRVFIFA